MTRHTDQQYPSAPDQNGPSDAWRQTIGPIGLARLWWPEGGLSQISEHRGFHETKLGRIIHGDCLDVLEECGNHSVNLIMTSPPFGLVRKKDYGNVEADKYLDWFRPFAADNGSLVIDIGGAWNKGYPTRNLYHFKLPIMLCEEFGFHLAQDFYWWNPSKLPTPAEWVTVRRNRVKDAVNTVWWLSPSPWPKASNRRVLQPYSTAMKELLTKGQKAKKRPSGHYISEKFGIDNGGAIPPNLIAIEHGEQQRLSSLLQGGRAYAASCSLPGRTSRGFHPYVN